MPATLRENLPFALKMKNPKKRSRSEIEDDGDDEEGGQQVYNNQSTSVILEPKEKKVRDLLADLQNVSIHSFYFPFLLLGYLISFFDSEKDTKTQKRTILGEETEEPGSPQSHSKTASGMPLPPPLFPPLPFALFWSSVDVIINVYEQTYLEKKRKGSRKLHIIKNSLIAKAKKGGFILSKDDKVLHQH